MSKFDRSICPISSSSHRLLKQKKSKSFLKIRSLVSRWIKKISKNINISQNVGHLKKNPIFTQKFAWLRPKKIDFWIRYTGFPLDYLISWILNSATV